MATLPRSWNRLANQSERGRHWADGFLHDPPMGSITLVSGIAYEGMVMARLIALLLLLAIGGCGEQEAPSATAPLVESETAPSAAPAPTDQATQVVLVMKTLTNPFFVAMEQGARRAEQELGIELSVQTAAQETSTQQQIDIVRRHIDAGVDAIVIAPGDSVELIPVLKQAQDAGIQVINIDNRLDPAMSEKQGLRDIPFISVDNEQAAYLSARYISQRIDTPTPAIILEGIRGAANAEERKNGALRAFAENPAIHVVAMETAHWKIDEGYEVTRQIFQAHENVGAMFCANDMMALGAIEYLKEVGKDGQVLVAAFDALEEASAALKEGSLTVTIDQQAAEQGYLGVHYAVRALAGETLPAETLVDVTVVDAAHLAKTP